MELGEGGALSRDDVLKSGLVNHDRVDLAFADDGLTGLGDGALGFVETEEHLALVEDGRLGRIQVLCLRRFFERASAEGDHLAIVIADREHEAMAESRIRVSALLAEFEDACIEQELLAELVFGCPMAQGNTVRRCVADHPALGYGGSDAATFEIGARFFRHRAFHEQLMIPRGQFLMGADHQGADFGFLFCVGVPDFFLNADVCRVSQALHGLHECQSIVLHDEAEGIATRTAAEAVVGIGGGPHVEGWRLLIVKRAQPYPVCACTAQFHRAPDEVHDVRGR